MSIFLLFAIATMSSMINTEDDPRTHTHQAPDLPTGPLARLISNFKATLWAPADPDLLALVDIMMMMMMMIVWRP